MTFANSPVSSLGLTTWIFATAPSMDGFVSIGAALITNYVKTTYQAHVPLAVIGDTDILAAAPMEMITAGLGDILGKYTCLLDWKMAHIITGEYYCSHIADMVKEAVEIVVEESTRIKDRNPDAVKAVTEALVLSGIAMRFCRQFPSGFRKRTSSFSLLGNEVPGRRQKTNFTRYQSWYRYDCCHKNV